MKKFLNKKIYCILFLTIAVISAIVLFPSKTKTKAQTETIGLVRQNCAGYSNCFTSLYAWEANYGGIDFTGCSQGDLVCAGVIAAARIDGTWINPDTQAVVIDGWTTDADHYIKIYTTDEARHDGKWNTNSYRIQSEGTVVNVSDNHIYIEGLQIDDTGSAGYGGIFSNGPYDQQGIWISENIIRCSGTCPNSSNQHGINLAGTAGVAKINNNIIYGFSNTSESYGMYLNQLYPRNNSEPSVYNNTVYGCYNGIMTDDDAYYYNNLSYNNSNADYAGQTPLSSGNNISSDNTSPDGASYQSRVVSFVDSVNNDFHLSSSDSSARDAGRNLSSDFNLAFSDDIDGDTRLGTWDIGADEYSGSAPPPTPPSDTTPPVLSNSSPLGALSSGTTQVIMSVVTNENATCRYSTTANSIYSLMINTFSTTGGISHSTTIAGLEDGNSYNYYVRCIDGSSNANVSDYAISFSVNQSAQEEQQEGVIFEDNFDSHNDWTITQRTDHITSCYSNCDVPSGWTAYYNGYSYCSGGPGNNNMYLESTNARGGSGKALTFWDESCTCFFEDSDGNLGVNLDQTYDELYVRFFIKFQPGYQTGQICSEASQHKLAHVQYWCGSGNPYSYFGNECNLPTTVPGFKTYLGNVWYYSAYRCEGEYYCQGTPSYDYDVSLDHDHLNLGITEENFFSENAGINNDGWHSMEFHYKMNTNNGATFNKDGVHRFWLDGVLQYDSTTHNGGQGIPWSDQCSDVDPRKGINFVAIGGNNNIRWTSSCVGTGCEQWYAVDDVVISTEYIGPDYIIEGGITSPPTDTTPPTGSVNINSGNQYASSTNVSLNISASDSSGVEEMRISNTNNFSSAVTEIYTIVKLFVLSSGDGLKTIYAWFKDVADNWMITPATDTIILDTVSPSISDISNSSITTSTATVTFTTNETTNSYIEYGFSASYGLNSQISANNTNFSIQLSSLSGNTTYHYRIISTDTAGNSSQSIDMMFTTIQVAVPDTTPPANISNLSSSNISQTSVNISWTSPGDDNNVGVASGYDIRYSTSNITDANWNSATQLTGEPTPQIAGTNQALYVVVGLSADTTYYFAIKTRDEAPNWSGLSNILAVKTLTASTPVPSATPSPSGGGGGGGEVSDTTAPSRPYEFNAIPADAQIILTWTNPRDTDFVRVLIVRKQGSSPTSKDDGDVIYEGTKEEYTDVGLDNNKMYYYSIFAYDKKPNYSSILTISSKPKSGETSITIPGKIEKTSICQNMTVNSLFSLSNDITECVSLREAKIIYNHNQFVSMNSANLSIYNRIATSQDKASLTENNKYSIAYLINNSTDTTKMLGAGERAGVINSFKSAFNKYPTTENDWQDVIKIANGRWPTQRNEQKENITKTQVFKKIYLRNPNMNNPHDNATVTVITYGLRPANRNLNSEKAGIKIFRNIYKYDPTSATDWDIVRAVAYSGATR
ncbi:MAG: fibronectin type III domain-containing protein [Candidatus Falkowbacteria bacterium]